ncbi:uncharacterized protein LOC143290795 [Babylonia areolata]|uniref:uncharacterized protein LOC143290795 n=1 Tax=Babylonia areolata TaxID=304850 RepID=UPI003FD4C1FC
MSEKKKAIKLPAGASLELKVSESGKKQWTEEAESLAERLAKAEWHSYSSRPRGESNGYFVVLHWYNKEKVWVPLYMQHGNVGSQLAKLFNNREATPICKYLSSFPRTQRKLLWLKWVLDLPSDGGKSKVAFKDVLRAFSSKYNQGETLAFNMDDEQPDIPENFSLLDY